MTETRVNRDRFSRFPSPFFATVLSVWLISARACVLSHGCTAPLSIIDFFHAPSSSHGANGIEMSMDGLSGKLAGLPISNSEPAAVVVQRGDRDPKEALIAGGVRVKQPKGALE